MKLQPQEFPQEPDMGFLSTLFSKAAPMAEWTEWAELAEEKEKSKIEMFQAGIAQELKPEDTIETAVGKVVKVALASEFGVSFARSKSTEPMISVIVRGIMGDSTLRKQALVLIDRYLKPAEMKKTRLPEKGIRAD